MLKQRHVSEDPIAYAASATHPSFGENTVPGTLSADRWLLKFEGEGVACEIPLSRLEIQIGESEEVYFSDPEQPDWSIYTSEARILKSGPLLRHAQTRAQIKAISSQGEVKKSLKITAAFLIGCAVVAMLATFLTGLMVRSLANRVPLKWEQDMGASTLAEIQQEHVFISNPKMMAALDRAVAPLLAAMPKNSTQYKFYIMEEPLPNAFSLPGGHMVVTTGLMYLVDGPEELAAVMSHEIAHQTEKHIFRKIISSVGPFIIFKMFVGEGALKVLSDNYQLLASQSFSQEYELEADAKGWDYLIAANIDPRSLIRILTKLKVEYGRITQGVDIQFDAYKSHPGTEKRINRLQAKWNKLKKKSDFITFQE